MERGLVGGGGGGGGLEVGLNKHRADLMDHLWYLLIHICVIYCKKNIRQIKYAIKVWAENTCSSNDIPVIHKNCQENICDGADLLSSNLSEIVWNFSGQLLKFSISVRHMWLLSFSLCWIHILKNKFLNTNWFAFVIKTWNSVHFFL